MLISFELVFSSGELILLLLQHGLLLGEVSAAFLQIDVIIQRLAELFGEGVTMRLVNAWRFGGCRGSLRRLRLREGFFKLFILGQ